jgi:LPXTG-motif cell wall-anchored protein
MFDSVTQYLVSFAGTMPVEGFTFVGSFVEEVVAPIPSPIVMTAAGSIANAQGHAFVYLFVLSLIGAAGKTLGALLVYAVSYLLGTVFVEKFGHFFGVQQADVDALRAKLGTGWHQLFSVTFLRALPIMSSAVVSVGCGVVRVAFPTYVVATIVGTIVRDFFYLYVGFSGVAAYHALVDGLDGIESIIQIVIGLLVVLFLGWLYWRRKRSK